MFSGRKVRRWDAIAAVMAVVAIGLFAAPGATAAEPAGDPTVRAIQQHLQDMGYDVTVVDGLYGPETRSAIEAFQEERNLEVTGEVTQKLRRRLDHLVFKRSDAAERTWRQSRLFLKALGYSPGAGGMDSVPARRALSAFAENYWMKPFRGFSRTFHDLIRRRVEKTSAAHRWLCNHHMADGAYSLAVEWCRRAAERGNASAQYHMGWMSYYGRGRARSASDAFTWFHRAARSGHTKAQVFTGLMYREGKGTARDIEAAMHWYREATGDETQPEPPPPSFAE